MSQGNIFVFIQRCHSKCWFDKLCISFDNYLVKDKYLYFGRKLSEYAVVTI